MQNRGGRGGRKGRNNSWWNRRRDKLRRPKSLGFESLESRLAMAVVINEFLADNESGITDLDDTRQDWIELKNTGLAAANIGGWYLTDDSLNLTKWQIPAGTTINPGQHLVIFASSKNLTGSELHTNFSLSKDGEDLLLVEANGTTVADAYIDFPAQVTDVSYGLGASSSTTANQTLVGASSAVRAYVPTGENAAIDDNWLKTDFDDSAWLSGTRSVGFDRNSDGIDLAPFIGRVLTVGEMSNTQTTVYVRYEFDVADKDQLTSLVMNLRFDDGFIMYLNGREVARANFAEDFVRPQPQWDSFAGNQVGTSSTAGAANRVGEADDLVTFDLTAFLGEFVNGTNLLAFHGVNSNSSSGSNTNRQDFFIEPVLVATRATGSAGETFLPAPTPGDDNGIGVLDFVADTNFSVDRGFYNSPQSVAITTATAGAQIRYTTDGSVPTPTSGTLYTGPIAISETTILRAIAYKDGYASTNVDTVTYIFLNDVIQQSAADVTQPYAPWGHDKDDADSASGYNLDDEADWEMDPDVVDGNEQAVKDALAAIPSMSLVLDWDDLFSGEPMPGTFPAGSNAAPQPQGIYIHGTSNERYASLEYINPNQASDTFHIDVGVETQGHSSTLRWNSDKMSFQVKFKFPYGPNDLNYPLFDNALFGDGAASEFDTLILDAMFNYAWHHQNPVQRDYARFITDQVVSDLQNLASGEGGAHGKYVHLYLNGLYWGLYNVHERPDESFASEYYGGDKDDFDVIKHANQDVNHEYSWVEGGVAAEQRFADLINATQAVQDNPTNAALYSAVEGMLDVDQFIDYMIVHYYGGNAADWSHNNWYATRDRNGGLWRFHAWDQEHAFPTTDNGDSFTQTTDLTGKDDFEAPTSLHVNLIDNAAYKLKFNDRVQALMRNGGVLTDAAAEAVYQARIDEITEAIIGESARWGDNRNYTDPYTQADFLAVNNAVMNDYFSVRTNAVIGHFGARGWLTTLAAPSFNNYGGEVVAGFDVSISKPLGSPGGAIIYYTTDGSDPRMADGNPNPAAISGAGPLTVDINVAKQVKARIRNGSEWSPLIDATFTLADPYPLRIVEFMYNSDNAGGEWIELLNTSDETIDLAGVQITEFSAGGYTFGSGTLGAGERIVVVQDRTAFMAAYPSVTNIADGVFSGSLANEGESIALRGPLGELLQRFTYDDNTPWPTSPDGDGNSLVYVGPFNAGEDPASGAPADPFDVAANWAASPDVGGSPGTDDESDPIPGDYDNSGEVDNLDYTKWKSQYGMTVDPFTESDGNGDGIVDAVDYTVWRNNFGAMAPAAGSGGLTSRGSGGLASRDDGEPATSNDVEANQPAAIWEEVENSDFTSFGLIVADTSGVTLASPIGASPASQSSAEAVDNGLLLWAVLGGDDAGADADESLEALVSSSQDDVDSTAAGLWEDEEWLLELASL
jgi:hypothetical protein